MSILNVDKIQPIGGGSTITVDATDIQASTGTIRASTFSGDVSATGIGVTSLNVAGVSTFTNELQITTGRLLVNHTSSRVVANVRAQVQLEGTTASTSAISITRNSASEYPPYLNFGKSRATSTGGNTIINNNDSLGEIRFSGADGADLTNHAASINAEVDGTPSSNVTPGRLIFSTTSSTGSDATEKLRITSGGKIGINDTTPDATLSVAAPTAFIDVGAAGGNRGKIGYSSNDLYFGTSSSSGEFIFKNNINSDDNPADSGTERVRIDSSGRVLIGKTSGDHILDINASNNEIRLTKDSASNYNGIQLDRDASGNAGGYFGLAGSTNHYITGSAQHDICVRSQANLLFSSGGATERLRITSTGEVNIGGSYTQTTNKLNVTGDAYVSDDIIAGDEIRNNYPTDFWATDNTFISLNAIGNLTHMGGYETNLTSNGYRDTNGQWVSYNASSQDGAAQIGLKPQGSIVFRTDASKANGTAHNPTTRLTIDDEGVRPQGGVLNLRNSGSTGNVTVNVLGVSGDSRIDLENTGNGNFSGIDFVRERSTGTGVVGGSIFMKSDTSSNDAHLYLQTQSASAQSPVTTALTNNNGVRLILKGGNGIFSVETGASERFRIASDGHIITTGGVTELRGGRTYSTNSNSTWSTMLTFSDANNNGFALEIAVSENNYTTMYKVAGAAKWNTAYFTNQLAGDSNHNHSKDITWRVYDDSGTKKLQFKAVSYTTTRYLTVISVWCKSGYVNWS